MISILDIIIIIINIQKSNLDIKRLLSVIRKEVEYCKYSRFRSGSNRERGREDDCSEYPIPGKRVKGMTD